MPYAIQWSRKAAKETAKLDATTADRVIKAVDTLATQPRPHGSEKLEGDIYRIEVWPYRVIYRVEDRALQVLVLRVAHRREVYRNLR